MSYLVAWLEEQIAADEEMALIFRGESRRDWSNLGCWEADDGRDQGLTIEPQRMRAECAAKRAIIRWWRDVYDSDERMGLETALECLAQVYADRPGYDPAWSAE